MSKEPKKNKIVNFRIEESVYEKFRTIFPNASKALRDYMYDTIASADSVDILERKLKELDSQRDSVKRNIDKAVEAKEIRLKEIGEYEERLEKAFDMCISNYNRFGFVQSFVFDFNRNKYGVESEDLRRKLEAIEGLEIKVVPRDTN